VKRWLFVALVLFGAGYWWTERPVHPPAGVLVAEAPRQTAVSGSPPALAREGYTITALARFELEARVLGKERYRFDRGAELAPVDLALGWGRMSDSAVLEKVEVSQGTRYYFWRTASFPIPRGEIEASSANMHMIPADAAVERRLKSVRPGQVVALSGYLVEVRGRDGWGWRSSLTRNDTGNAACELVWVERIAVR
jgi:hypothetical protein